MITFLSSWFGEVKFKYPWFVMRQLFSTWTVTETLLYDPQSRSVFQQIYEYSQLPRDWRGVLPPPPRLEQDYSSTFLTKWSLLLLAFCIQIRQSATFLFRRLFESEPSDLYRAQWCEVLETNSLLESILLPFKFPKRHLIFQYGDVFKTFASFVPN